MNLLVGLMADIHRTANSALDRAERDAERPRDIMEDVLDPEELNDLKGNLDRQNIVYIQGIAYELAMWGDPFPDGSRKAVLRVWRPF